MHPGGPAGQPATTATGTVTGHSYTAAYRYQLVIGKVGGWAIPYPLTIPQAVTGLSAVVVAMVTASWWYPFTGIGGLLGVVALPIIAIRVISRIRPEGRSVSDWLYGWSVAQRHGLIGRGVRLHVGVARTQAEMLPTPVPGARAKVGSRPKPGITNGYQAPGGASAPMLRAPHDEQADPPACPQRTATRVRRRATASPSRQADPPHTSSPRRLTGLLREFLPGRRSKANQTESYRKAQRSARSVQPIRRNQPRQVLVATSPDVHRRTAQQLQPVTRHAGWSALARFFSKSNPPPAPAQVPIFDPWGYPKPKEACK